MDLSIFASFFEQINRLNVDSVDIEHY